jgi:deoxyribodipyrimidine photo-lyase
MKSVANSHPVALFWFRRDLRLEDNAGLYHALKGPLPVLPVFIFDSNILDDLPERKDARVEFIHHAVAGLKNKLEEQGSTLVVRYGKPEQIWPQLLQDYPVGAVYTNRDYEPYALERDTAAQTTLAAENIPFYTFKDHVIFEKDEILKDDGTPYTVFTPYSRKWLAKLQTRRFVPADGSGAAQPVSFYLASYPTAKYAGNFFKSLPTEMPTLPEISFEPAGIPFPPAEVARGLIRSYNQTRDFPAIDGTSRLGVHFRFGTISIREKARHAQLLNDTYLNELIWRDFYSQILAHFPRVVTQPFKSQYAHIPWRDAPGSFNAGAMGKRVTRLWMPAFGN